MRFKFSVKTTVICALLALGMIRLSFWQWDRHIEKKEYIKLLTSSLNMEVLPYNQVVKVNNWNDYIHRRIEVIGEYDFSNEIIINNRRRAGMPGVFVVTPLKLKNKEDHVLVNRGFIPFSEKNNRDKFKNPSGEIKLTTLVKESKKEKYLGPKDPINSVQDKALSWERVNTENISKQLEYKILPIYLEIMPSDNLDEALKSVVSSSKGKDEILNLAMSGVPHAPNPNQDWTKYPIPSFSTVIPPGRHFGYVFEWGVMALLTLIIGLILQLKRS